MSKNKILKEAFDLFARQGYYCTSMQQISDAVNLDKSSLYAHFKSKNEIFFKVIDIECNLIIEKILDNLHQNTIKELIREIFQRMIIYYSDKNKLLFWKQMNFLASNGSKSEISEKIQKSLAQLYSTVRSCIVQTVDFGNISAEKQIILFRYFYIVFQGFLDWFLIQEKVNDQFIDIAMEMFDDMTENSVFGQLLNK